MVKNGPPIEYYPVEVQLSSSTLNVGVIQLEGPLPAGKQISTVRGRQRYTWTQAAAERLAKAARAIDTLLKDRPEVNIVVVPEYSVPLDYGTEILADLARQHRCFVIAGADNLDASLSAQFNCCLIFTPDSPEPLIVRKTRLSRWEDGFVDVPSTTVRQPVLRWKVNDRWHWIGVFTCLDLTHAIGALPTPAFEGSGVVIAPMCSPDLSTFRAYADAIMRNEDGAAVIFCNAVGEQSAGASSIYAVASVTTGPNRAAIELPAFAEGAFVTEIRCDHLAPNRKTPVEAFEPLGFRKLYTMSGGGELIAADQPRDTALRRAVPNPALFAINGKQLRIAFLSLDDISPMHGLPAESDFEILLILGPQDLLVTHLHDSPYSLFIDAKSLPIRPTGGRKAESSGKQSMDDDSTDWVPFFEVETFYKFRGIEVTTEDQAIFKRPGADFPSDEDFAAILRLVTDWEDQSVKPQDRRRYLQKRWILDITTGGLGDIDAVMTVHLDHAGSSLADPQFRFVDRVLPLLLKKAAVTSAYRGTGHSINAHFVIRVSASKDELYQLILEVHQRARAEKVLIRTTTYVVIHKFATLDLTKACSTRALPPDESYFWYNSVVPLLDTAGQIQARRMEVAHRQICVPGLRRLSGSFDRATLPNLSDARRHELRKGLTAGLLFLDYSRVRPLHDVLQAEVERLLRDTLTTAGIDGKLSEYRQLAGLAPGKSLATLTYNELIRLMDAWFKRDPAGGGTFAWTERLVGTVAVRNAFAHTRYVELSPTGVVDALDTYMAFIAEWPSNG